MSQGIRIVGGPLDGMNWGAPGAPPSTLCLVRNLKGRLDVLQDFYPSKELSLFCIYELRGRTKKAYHVRERRGRGRERG